jgi:hypothetical protein
MTDEHPEGTEIGDRSRVVEGFLICVGDPRKGLGSVGCFVLFGLVPARALCRWTAVGVEVERPQRSEDERPRDRRGSAVELAGLGRRKDVVVQAICDLS